jgi:hypothetical protein
MLFSAHFFQASALNGAPEKAATFNRGPAQPDNASKTGNCSFSSWPSAFDLQPAKGPVRISDFILL